MTDYFQPLAQFGTARPAASLALAGGRGWFTHVKVLSRQRQSKIILAGELPERNRHALTTLRAPVAGLSMDNPRLMGILNVTPDSFSDGGRFDAPDLADARALEMVRAGADIIDIGGESTRPGAAEISANAEIERTIPVIRGLRDQSAVPISIDTRKSTVAAAALAAGGSMINDVSALGFDPKLAGIAAKSEVPICLMHAQGEPGSMQDAPEYDDVLLDVYDFLAARISQAENAGIDRKNIIVDPGIGFGKTLDHNLTLLQNIALFHGLGCPVLLGASRKRFIGTLGDAPDPQGRMPGSLAVALAAIGQGVQIVRVHDISQMRQALTLWSAVTGMRQI